MYLILRDDWAGLDDRDNKVTLSDYVKNKSLKKAISL